MMDNSRDAYPTHQRKVPKSAEVEVDIRLGRGLTTPAQKQAWRRFWQKVITELKGEDHGNQ